MIKSICMLIFSAIFLFVNNSIGQSHKPPRGIEHVVVIGIDGPTKSAFEGFSEPAEIW
ncbi:MAG TPA: hypothetical protein PLL71_10385 [Agriterribacter sp.]|mgnify:CR=1 FL=1|nr:hypothetical protein [Agriterribacter sp.]HRQ49680.1 hypothetical protein [Agriterribacter sp.]